MKALWDRFSSVQSLRRVRLFANPWTAARQASLSITNSHSSPKPMSIKLVMQSNHLILCPPLLLLPSIFPSIRVFSNESALHIRWPKYWTFSFSISPSNEYSGLINNYHLIQTTLKWENWDPEKLHDVLKVILSGCGNAKTKTQISPVSSQMLSFL